MKKLETFLNSGLYISIIFLITFVSWSFYHETPPHAFNIYNISGLLILVLINTAILILFKNTLYSIPTLFSFLFISNQSGISFESLSQLWLLILAFSIFLIGPMVHFIRFKPKLKKGKFFLGFALMAVSYLAPIIFMSNRMQAFLVSFAGTLFLGLYVFYSSTLKGNLNYLFKMLMFANLLLTAQVFFFVYQGYLLNPELDLYHRIYAGWGRTFGWANVNSICFYITLTFPSYLYFIFKKPKTYLIWFAMILPVIAVILTKSRGGMLGLVVATLGMILFFILKGNKKHLLHGLVFLVFSMILFYIFRGAIYLWWEFLLESLGNNLNDFSSSRLVIYEQGWLIFKQYPVFGGSWLAINSFSLGQELFMFHDTFIHVLATMGIFGLIALLVHYYQIGKFMFINHKLEKSLFLTAYIATQIHGLIENVQFAVPYSILIVIILSVFETSEKQTSFDVINNRYHLIEEIKI